MGEITPEIKELISHMVGSYYKRVKHKITTIEWQDLESAAYEGVLKHRQTTKSLPSHFIRWAIVDEIRRWAYDTRKVRVTTILTDDVEDQTDDLAYEEDIEKQIYIKRAGICVRRMIRHYSDLQRKITERFLDGASQFKIATELNVSEAYVCQVLKVVKEKLRPELEPWNDL